MTTVFVMTPTEFQRMRIQRSSKQELRRHKKGRLREMLNSPVTCFNCANKRRTRALIESALWCFLGIVKLACLGVIPGLKGRRGLLCAALMRPWSGL